MARAVCVHSQLYLLKLQPVSTLTCSAYLMHSTDRSAPLQPMLNALAAHLTWPNCRMP